MGLIKPVFLLTLFLSSTSIENAPVGDHNCIFHFTDDQNGFQFINCQIANYQSAQWNYCFIYCCSNLLISSYQTPSKAAIQQCQHTETLSTFIISLIVVSVLITLCFGLYCIVHICKKWKSRSRMQVHKERVISIQWLNEPDVNYINSDIIWSSRARKWNKLRVNNEPCTICLEDGTTTELFCLHQYHPKCIGQWLKKNNICPCCRLDNIRGLKIYCEDCRWRYFVCLATLITEEKVILPEKCSACLKKKDNAEDSLVEIYPQHSTEVLERVQRNIKQDQQG